MSASRIPGPEGMNDGLAIDEGTLVRVASSYLRLSGANAALPLASGAVGAGSDIGNDTEIEALDLTPMRARQPTY